MMGVSEVFIFALLFILYTGGNSEDPSNITDSSNHHHHLHPRAKPSRAKAVKDKNQSPVHINTYLEFVASYDPPEDAVQVPVDKSNDYYILGSGKCNEEKLETRKSSDISSNKEKRAFLVNKDDFEVLEWKKWSDIKKGKIPFYPILICKSKYIVKDKVIEFLTIDSLKKRGKRVEVYTVNYDIKDQDFQTDYCEDKKEVKQGKIKVIKRVTADNKNCKPAKHVVQFDHGSDISRSFLKGSTHAVGGALEASATGKILGLFEMSGKLSGKYDYSRQNSETTSNLDKVLHSMSMEIEIPPNHSCTIEIKSKTSTDEVQCSGRLIRQYKNGDESMTLVTGIYREEVAELITSVNPCTPVPDGAKC